jgi:hypothetical protein
MPLSHGLAELSIAQYGAKAQTVDTQKTILAPQKCLPKSIARAYLHGYSGGPTAC